MATITDVARAAKVSITTVSRVINQPELVQPETRDRVTEVMRALDYTPNALAHGLRSGHVKTIALLVGDISGPFHGTFAKHVNREGEARGYRVILRDLDQDVDKLVRVLNETRASEASGVVIAIANNLDRPDVRAALAAARGRGLSVIINSQVVDPQVPAILPEFDKLAIRATEVLDEMGIGPILFITGGPEASLARVGSRGFREAMARSGRDDSSGAILDGRFMVERSRQAIKDHLAAHPSFHPAPGRPLGVITQSTRMAVGTMLAGFDLGLSVPGDIAIICTEELPQATEFHPELTTLAIPVDELARCVFDQLLAKEAAQPVTYLEPLLIERGSTPPRSGA